MKCRKNTEGKNPKAKTSKVKLMLLSKFGCIIVNNQDLRISILEIISILELKTYLRKIPLLGDNMFQRYKMNKILNKFLLAGAKFVLETHLRQPGFTYSACGQITKNK